ncbi:hypothetical protein ABZ802_07290 [Streptomyces sp. NPDC047737]|uniref:hypothetical protein n=1 Tax=unclassified Streptomyces TaxID=2593676 RepID=UPI0033F84BD4
MDEEIRQPAGPAADRVRCARCGTTADSDGPPPTWLCSVENGTRQYFCEACSRAHIRAIESRLDSDWW